MVRRLGFGLILAVAGMQSAWAWECSQIVSVTTPYQCVTTVFNDSGSALTSGTVVSWDNDDTEFDRTGYPQVTTTTTADDDWTAGVILDASCADQSLCVIVEHGFALTRIAQATAITAEDTLVGTSTVAGRADDYGTGANSCALGNLIEARNPETGGAGNDDNQVFPFSVNINCN